MKTLQLQHINYGQIARFGIAGGVTTVIHLTIFSFLVFNDALSPALASGFAFLCAFSVSYVLQKFWTFSDSGLDNSGEQLAKFFIMQMSMLFLNMAGVHLLTQGLGVPAIGAQTTVLIVAATLSYLILKYLIFVPPTESESEILARAISFKKNLWLSAGSGHFLPEMRVRMRKSLNTFSVHSKQLHVLPKYDTVGDHLFVQPEFSVKKQFHTETVAIILVAAVSFAGLAYLLGLVFSINSLVVVSLLVALFYFVFFVFKLVVITVSLFTKVGQVSDAEVADLSDAELPVYSVFIPLRDEAEVIDQIVTAITSIDYPQDKLDVVITVEQYDIATKEALAAADTPVNWRMLELPDTAPKTKPKAMNCAFLQAKGEYLVIFDAEIIPEPTQLKKAIVMFRRHKEYAALQPRLDHYNTEQNLITRLFTMEFTFYYDLFLPGLMKLGLPVPLSGHSTHFRIGALRRAGAWDPYNVAEDCEVGMRLFRLGYRAGFLDSVSLEEAASTVRSWISQRTRWMKGFIQTAIVHLRYPRLTLRQMGGWRNFLVFLLLVPGTVLINVLNLIMWGTLIIWMIWHPAIIKEMYPMGVLYLANLVALIGGFLFVYLNTIALYRRGKFSLVRYWFFIPVYWILLAYATVRASKQIITAPHLWEKTAHGTHITKAQV